MQNTNQKVRNIQKRVGQNIHAIRQERQLTLKRFSKMTGISVDLLDQYELGKNQLHLRELIRISAALNLEVERLMKG